MSKQSSSSVNNLTVGVIVNITIDTPKLRVRISSVEGKLLTVVERTMDTGKVYRVSNRLTNMVEAIHYVVAIKAAANC